MGDRFPRGNRIAVVTLSGGAGILMADRCSEAGLVLPQLSADTVAELRRFLPSFAAVGNPVDLTAGVLNDPAMFGRALRVIAADPGVDMLGLPLAAISGKLAMAPPKRSSSCQGRLGFRSWWPGTDRGDDRTCLRSSRRAGIPRYRSPVRCARGFASIWQWTEARRRHAGRKAGLPRD